MPRSLASYLLLAGLLAPPALPAGGAPAASAAAGLAAEAAAQRGGQRGRQRGGGAASKRVKAMQQKRQRAKAPRPTGAAAGRALGRAPATGAGRLLVPPAAPADAAGDAAALRPVDRSQPGIATQIDLQQWFGTCDHDLDGWISYSEAKASLAFSRERFGYYDLDRDGRLTREEFDMHYHDSVRHTGGFRPPKPLEGPAKPPPRTPQQLLNAYDADLDGFVDGFELERVLADYARLDLDPAPVLASLDRDDDGRLALAELEALRPILEPTTAVALPEDGSPRPTVTSIDELFGKVHPRGSRGFPQPPLIEGPVPLFRRLDLDDDGAISLADLEELLRPIQLPLRAHTVLNTLDTDRDGVLSEGELLRCLERPARDERP